MFRRGPDKDGFSLGKRGNLAEVKIVYFVLDLSDCVLPVRKLSSAQRVGFFNIRSGRVLDKIPGSGSGRVR